jgi:hypothetical protein
MDRWGAEAVRTVFAAIVRHAPACVVGDMIAAAKSCQEDIVEIERTKQAAALLGVDYDDVEKFLEQRKREQHAGAAVH